jgi:hypothetical protein
MKRVILTLGLGLVVLSGCTSTAPTAKQSPEAKPVASTGRFVPTPGFREPLYAPYGPSPAPYYPAQKQPWERYGEIVDEYKRQIDADAAQRDAEYARDNLQNTLNQIESNQRIIENRLQYGY